MASLERKRRNQSLTRPIIVSTDCVGLRPRARADALRRSQWRSRSGVTPSKARAPSKTEDPSQNACVRGPATSTLPSCQSPSSHVQVSDHVAIFSHLSCVQYALPSHGAESVTTLEVGAGLFAAGNGHPGRHQLSSRSRRKRRLEARALGKAGYTQPSLKERRAMTDKPNPPSAARDKVRATVPKLIE